MKLDLFPIDKSENSLIGKLSIDGVFECWTLENPDHLTPLGPDHIASPCGTYPIQLYSSPHFARMAPILMDIPGRSFVEIHVGNTSRDTHECILIGKFRAMDFIGESNQAVDALIEKIANALAASEEVTITVQDAP